MAESEQKQQDQSTVCWALQAAILDQGEALWDAAEQRRSNAFLKGRAQNTQRYKPGTQEVLLMFSDKEGGSVYRFPYYGRFKNVIEPLLEQVTGIRLAIAFNISRKSLCAPTQLLYPVHSRLLLGYMLIQNGS